MAQRILFTHFMPVQLVILWLFVSCFFSLLQKCVSVIAATVSVVLQLYFSQNDYLPCVCVCVILSVVSSHCCSLHSSSGSWNSATTSTDAARLEPAYCHWEPACCSPNCSRRTRKKS